MNKRKYRLSDIVSVFGLLVIIYGFAAAHFITPDKTFSEDENRSLKAFPEFSVDSLVDGSFTSDIAAYCTDQMPLRNLFVGTKAVLEASMYKNENNGVILGSDGYIISKEDYPDFASADSNLSSLVTFAELIGDKPVKIAIAGRSQDVLLSKMQSLYPADYVSDKAVSYVTEGLSELDTVDIITPLRERADNGEYVYYRTDHHWTTLGAYYAYAEIMEAFNISPLPLDFFERQTVSESFYGTTWSKAGMKWISPDSIEFFRFEGDTDLVCEITDTQTTLEGLYDSSYLDKKDKYSSFIGGNNGRVLIRSTQNTDRETLLLIKDSFAHSVAPFLAAHFDLDIIDLRYYKPIINGNPSVKQLAENSNRTLVLYNIDSIYTKNTLATLNMGVQ